jgi:alkaline phosphatase
MKRLIVRLLLVMVAATLSVSGLYAQPACHGDKAEQQVKNVILMVGDGMGVAQVTSLILDRNMEKIEMERATAIGLVRTFSANNRVTDSAASGTAFATGTKTNNGMLGVAPDSSRLTSILERSRDNGLSTGLVVTVRITHATPGAFYAHVPSRKDYDKIAEQFLDSGIDVALGGGRKDFNDRDDKRDLVAELRAKGYRVEFDFDECKDIDSGKLVGLFCNGGSMPYITDGRSKRYLPDATAKALQILDNNDKGFFLMVEGSLIDYGGHDNNADVVKAETADFDNAVGVAFDYADAHPGTLVVVMADHETGGLTIPSGNSDFTAAESGINYKFSTDGHTASMIALYAYGTGAGNFSRVMDNTDIPKIISRLLGLDR